MRWVAFDARSPALRSSKQARAPRIYRARLTPTDLQDKEPLDDGRHLLLQALRLPRRLQGIDDWQERKKDAFFCMEGGMERGSFSFQD